MRCLNALLLFLSMLALFCPVFHDELSFAITPDSSKSEIIASIENKEVLNEPCTSSIDCQGSDHDEKNACDGECLCHTIVLTTQSTINLTASVTSHEKIAFGYGNSVQKPFSPPFEPPRHS